MVGPDPVAPPSVRLFRTPALLTGEGERWLAPRRSHQLLAFLACRRHWVGRAELAELFWPDRPEGAARANLRVLLQRVREEFGLLELQAERVRCVVDSDLARFEAALAAGRDDQAVECYRPPLLQGLEPGLPEPLLDWLGDERQRLDGLWRSVVQRRLGGLPAAAASALTGRLEELEPGSAAAERVLGAAAQRADPDTFVGRRAELAELAARLRAGTRALVVMGPGGIGKSAFLRAVLAQPDRGFEGEATWVPLVDLDRVAQAPARIALALGQPLRPAGDPWQQLQAAVGTRPWLLVLDNAEHLEGLEAPLEAWLAACPGLRLLVGTRRRPDLVASVLVLEGLPLPDDDDAGDAQALRRFDAVRLFEARARAAAPAADVVQRPAALLAVLRATEGLPLALELAAAATRFMPLEAVAAELGRSLEVLDAGGGARGIGACFERSWTLLAPPARAGLARLAWLPGAFTRGMAERVAGVGLAGLATLVDRSLLRADRGGRLSLHPLLRQFVAARQPPDDVPALAARHAAFVDHLLAAVDAPHLVRSAAALALVDDEGPHLRAAWAWALDAGTSHAAGLLSRLARTLGQYHVMRGGVQELRPWLETVVQRIAIPGRAGLAVRAVTLRTQAMLEYHAGALAEAQEHARQALRWAGQAGEPGTALACLTVLGNALHFAGQVSQARPHFERAYRMALQRQDRAVAGAAANGLGLVERAAGHLDAAMGFFRASGALAAEIGDAGGQVVALINLGNVQTLMQHWEDARRTNEAALALAVATGMESRRAILHTVLAEVAHETGDRSAARHHIGQAFATLERSSDSVVPTQVQLTLAAIETADGRLDQAAAALADGLAAARASGSSTMQLSGVNAAAGLLEAAGASDDAVRLWHWVAGHAAATASLRAAAMRRLEGLGRPPPALPEPGIELPAMLDALLQRLRPVRSIRS